MAAFAKSWRRDVLINAQIAAGYARLVAVASPLVLNLVLVLLVTVVQKNAIDGGTL